MTTPAADTPASGPASGPASAAAPALHLRQMIAVLERERQALAALDADALFASAREKESLCDALAALSPGAPFDHEARDLAETARRLNEVNRRVRNLLAANVSARIEALGGPAQFARRARAAASFAPR